MPPRPTIQEEGSKESEPELEYEGDNEEIQVNMMTTEDIENPEEEDWEYRSGGRVSWTGHDEIIERLSNATSYQQRRATEDRLISGVRINYK